MIFKNIFHFNNLNTPVFTTVLVYLLSFFATMVFSHILGTELMGEYYLFLSYYSFFVFLSGSAISSVMANITDRNDIIQMENIYSAIFIIRTVLVLVTVCIILLFQPAHYDLLILSVILATALSILTSGIHAENRIACSSIIGAISDIFKLGIQVIFVLIGFSIGGMLCGVILGLFASICVAFTQKNLNVSFKFTWSVLKENFKQILPFFLILSLYSGATILMGNFSPMLMDYYCSATDISLFKSASNISMVAGLFVSAVGAILVRQGSNIDKFKLKNILYLCVVCTVPIVLGGCVLNEWLLYFCFGADFVGGASCLVILLLFKLFENIGGILLSVIMYGYNCKLAIIIACLTCLVFMGLDLVFIPLWGIEGACFANIISFVICTLGVSLVYCIKKRLFGIDIWNCLKVILIGLLMAIVVFVLSMILSKTFISCSLLIGIGGIIYVGGLFIFCRKELKDSYKLISNL